MVTLYVNSRRANTGKTTFIMGLALKMMRDDFKVGFMKPVGRLPVYIDDTVTDQDALFIKDCLKLDEPLDQICPVVKTYDFIQDIYAGKEVDVKGKIKESFDALSAGKDIVMLEGDKSIFEGSLLGVNGVDIANLLDAKVILVDEYISDMRTADYCLSIKNAVGERLAGVIINKVPDDQEDYVKSKVVPFLEKKGINVIAVVPKDKVLGSISVRTLVEIFNGQVLCCPDKLDELVENFVVGAMGMETAFKYFKKITNKAVLTGGDRSDIQISALETSIKCLILTGGLVPNQIVISKAEEKGVPVISVRDDTFSVIEIFEKEMKRLEIREEQKIDQISRVIEENIDLNKFYKDIGLR